MPEPEQQAAGAACLQQISHYLIEIISPKANLMIKSALFFLQLLPAEVGGVAGKQGWETSCDKMAGHAGRTPFRRFGVQFSAVRSTNDAFLGVHRISVAAENRSTLSRCC